MIGENESTPIWWCIVKQEPIHYGQISCWRIIKAIKTTFGETDKLYQEHIDMFSPGNSGQLPYPMLFHREPDETPLTDWFEKDKLERDMGYK
jgi:hypothetical protein